MDFVDRKEQEMMMASLVDGNHCPERNTVVESDHEDYRTFPLAERAFTWEALN